MFSCLLRFAFAALLMLGVACHTHASGVVYTDDFEDISTSLSGFSFSVFTDSGLVFSDGTPANNYSGFIGSGSSAQLVVAEEPTTGVGGGGAIATKLETFNGINGGPGDPNDTSQVQFFGSTYTDTVIQSFTPGLVNSSDLGGLTVSFDYKTELAGEYSVRVERLFGDFANRLDLGVLPNTNGAFQNISFNLSDGDPGQLLNLLGAVNSSNSNQIQLVFGNSGDPNAYQHTSTLFIDNISIESAVPARLNTGTFAASPNPFTFGSFSETGAVDSNGANFVINADPNGAAGPSGGLGIDGFQAIDFDPTQHQLEVEARLLGGNSADSFLVLLSDLDGDDSGPGLGSDDYIFGIDTSNFSETEFSTFTLPLGTPSGPGIITSFGFTNGGDGIQNFGLTRLQIQSDGSDPGILNLEIARVEIVEAPQLTGDFNGDGLVDGFDFLSWQRGESPNPLSASDLADWEANYGNSLLSPLATAVPEPTVFSVVGLGAVCFLSIRKRL